jgi:Mg-chelatase subunit ChlD
VRSGRFGGTLIIKPRVVQQPVGKFFGIAVGGPSVVAVIDRSGSMTGSARSPEVAGRISKMAMARRELARFISSLPSEVSFDVRTFNTRDSGLMNALVPATEKNKLTAKLWMQTLPVTGGTVIIRSLRRALSSGAATILLLSDGMPNSSSEQRRILRLVERAHAQTGVVINVVGVGMTKNNRLLSSIAGITGGAYVIR